MVCQKLDQAAGLDVGVDIQLRSVHHTVPVQSPLPHQCTVIGNTVTSDNHGMLDRIGSKSPDIIEIDSEPHDQAIVIFQLGRCAWCAVFFDISRRGANQPPL